MIYNSDNFTKTEELGLELAKSLQQSGIRRAFIALFGEVGVGKTVFTRGFASYFGIKGIKSPTYTIVNEHKSQSAAIYHFDFYRIESEDDLLSIGYDEYLSKDGYIIAEWCEKIPEEIPQDAIYVKISRCSCDPEKRIIEINREIRNADAGI